MSNARDLADSAQIINILDVGGNLNSFVTTFTLPVADGTAGQVISTDGAGNLVFIAGGTPTVIDGGTP